MRHICTALFVIVTFASAVAQQTSNTPAASSASNNANPVTSTVRMIFERQQRNLIGAAEAMPADKYSFRPTPQQMTFAHLMAHITESNHFLCSKFGGTAEAPKSDVKDSDGKDKIVSALKASFDYCATALRSLDDSKLGETVTLYGGRQLPRAAALIALTNDFADHYAAAAMYLRLNGILPPSAQHQQQQPRKD
jgi:uncharacterized damage-inducible protein DinB